MALCTIGFTEDPVTTDTSPYLPGPPYSGGVGNIILYAVPNNYVTVIDRETLLSFRDQPPDQRAVFRVKIVQDAVGGRVLTAIAPGTIAWAAGTPPVMPTAAGAFFMVRLTWLGAAMGFVGELF